MRWIKSDDGNLYTLFRLAHDDNTILRYFVTPHGYRAITLLQKKGTPEYLFLGPQTEYVTITEDQFRWHFAHPDETYMELLL